MCTVRYHDPTLSPLPGTALAVIIPEGLQALIAGARESLQAAELKTAGSEGAHQHQHNPEESIDKSIGMSLVLGFLFMLLIDQLASRR